MLRYKCQLRNKVSIFTHSTDSGILHRGHFCFLQRGPISDPSSGPAYVTNLDCQLLESFDPLAGFKVSYLHRKIKNKPSLWINDPVQLKTYASNAGQGETQRTMAASKTLKPCSDTPPNLVGPIHVDFNSARTLDEVREESGSPLQEGGWYKPPDCIAKQKVAIIIPFRNRHEHLKHWLYYLHPILMRQQLNYRVYVINQDGDGVFNRAKLMNVGCFEALKEYDFDCFVFSDIDLVPMDDRNLYRCFNNPRHLSVAVDKFNFKLPYEEIFGGVISLSKKQYLKMNGFPNTFWGWGGEDDDIYQRIMNHGMSISRPDMVTGKYKMIKHKRDVQNHCNPRNVAKLKQTKNTMDKDGINSLKYTVKETVKDKLYTYINVNIGLHLF
ncbi:beta-1,4-galactosyltransferase 2-like [Plectropomus leopardus]|uniref:beta-1,4-galactosyltransferase 2-like n=1 Tax=Plectropomus leopardus TaxID=160734 RepID=UPI001C4CA2E3|nr:beta-1,4-galactosyltransferase 2-like [Plectropomus leopardus]